MADTCASYLETVCSSYLYYQTCHLTLYISLVARFVTESKKGLKKGEEFLGPLLRERLGQMDKFGGEWSDKPVGVRHS